MSTSFGFPFRVDGAGRIHATGGDEAIRGKIIQVLFTARGERVHLPEFGCGLFNLVFEPNDDILAAATEFTIGQALTRWLRDDVVVDGVSVESVDEKIFVEALATGGEGTLRRRYRDLGDRMDDVVLLTLSEFGRTARENGNRGTDHGHANVMFAMGGKVRGGKVYGRWPGLAPEALYEGRDLTLTTDFRTVCGEAIGRHLGQKELNNVFPGFRSQVELGILI